MWDLSQKPMIMTVLTSSDEKAVRKLHSGPHVCRVICAAVCGLSRIMKLCGGPGIFSGGVRTFTGEFRIFLYAPAYGYRRISREI